MLLSGSSKLSTQLAENDFEWQLDVKIEQLLPGDVELKLEPTLVWPFFTTAAGLWPFLLRDSIETTPLEPTAPLGVIERQSRPLRRLRKSGSILMSLSFSIPRPLSPLHKNYFYFCKPAFECKAFELNYFAFKVAQENGQHQQHNSKSTYLTSKRSWALILPGAFSLFAISSVALNRSLAEM